MSFKKLRNKIKEVRQRYFRRKHRVNTIIKKNSDLPRLIVFKSRRYIYAQIVDKKWNVLASASDLKIQEGKRIERASKVWEEIAKKALEKWIEKVAFDRNGFLYHWRVKALAESAREAGLKF